GKTGSDVIPLVQTYAKFWQMIITDQGQSRGAPIGMLLQLRAMGAKKFFERFGLNPSDLFLNYKLDDLYRYSESPIAELRQAIVNNFLNAGRDTFNGTRELAVGEEDPLLGITPKYLATLIKKH